MVHGGSSDDGSSPTLSELILGLARRIENDPSPGSRVTRLLAGLMEEDPLGTWDRCCSWVTREGYLLEPGRLTMRALAWIVYRCSDFDETESAEEWFEDRITEGAKSLIEEEIQDSEAYAAAGPDGFSGEARFWFLTRTLGVAPESAWNTCLRLNIQPAQARRAFMAVARDRLTFDQASKELGTSRDAVRSAFTLVASHLEIAPMRLQALLDQEQKGAPRE